MQTAKIALIATIKYFFMAVRSPLLSLIFYKRFLGNETAVKTGYSQHFDADTPDFYCLDPKK